MEKSYGQLSLEEREEIAFHRRSGLSLRAIGALLGRCASTISREIRRNTVVTKQWPKPGYGVEYTASRAAFLARRRRRWRLSRFKLARQPELLDVVKDHLAMGWSPQQIAGRLALENGAPVISHESIYRYIYHRQKQGEHLYRLLPQKRAYRRHRRTSRGLHLRFGPPQRKGLDLRPAGANERREQGHWEADLMLFSTARFGLLVTVDRASRYLMASRHDTRTAKATMNALIQRLGPLPGKHRRTITFDQGKEFWHHHRLEKECGIDAFFCQPKSPWQKGTVENTIGRLRRWLPRKTELDAISEDKLNAMIDNYNKTPRKCLGYKTPDEVKSNQTVALVT